MDAVAVSAPRHSTGPQTASRDSSGWRVDTWRTHGQAGFILRFKLRLALRSARTALPFAEPPGLAPLLRKKTSRHSHPTTIAAFHPPCNSRQARLASASPVSADSIAMVTRQRTNGAPKDAVLSCSTSFERHAREAAGYLSCATERAGLPRPRSTW